jgi:mannitol-specific phosphotransferase system IIBC component
MFACAFVAETFSAVDFLAGRCNHHQLLILPPAQLTPVQTALLVFVLPMLWSFTLGAMWQSRRWGAASGLAIAATILVYFFFSAAHIDADVTLLLGIVLSGFLGAQARRVVSRRQASNRSRRTIIREQAL